MDYFFEEKKGIMINNAFQSVLNELMRKPNKVWVDKGSEFYMNISMKSLLKVNDIEMYSIHNEGRSNYKYMVSIQNNLYIDKLDDVINECNNNVTEPFKRILLM